MQAIPKITTWLGQDINTLPRETLLEIIGWCGEQITELRADRDRWHRAGDPLKYLMDDKP